MLPQQLNVIQTKNDMTIVVMSFFIIWLSIQIEQTTCYLIAVF